MTSKLNTWRRVRRYRTTARALRSLPPDQLRALGLHASQIDRLACEVSRVPWR